MVSDLPIGLTMPEREEPLGGGLGSALFELPGWN